MKKVFSLVVLAVLLSLSVTSTTSADSGIIMLVYPTGSLYGEAIKVGVSTAPETWSWGTTHNPNAKVNIGLDDPNGLLYSDIRLGDQKSAEHFGGKIWSTDQNQEFEIRSGYIANIHGGPWTLPDRPATIAFWQDNFQKYQTITIEKYDIGNWPKIITGLKGDWQFDITLYQTIPEPGSILALGSGLIGLVGFGFRRRR